MSDQSELERKALLVNPPKTARGQETLDRICQSAEQAFFKKGYYNTSISDITSVAGISTGTFYLYFESKIMLYEYLISQYGHTIRKYIHEHVSHCTDRKQREREGMRAWMEYISHHKYVFSITWESLFIDRRLFDKYYAEFAASYMRQISIAQSNGEIQDIDPEVLSFALMGMTNFIGMHWILFRDEQNFDYLADEISKIIDGIFPNTK